MTVSIGFALLAGLASFLSPCVLSLMPAYVGYLGGRALSINENAKEAKWLTFLHGLFFVFGFSIVFITLGLTISVAGGILNELRLGVSKFGGVVIIIFGLHLTKLINIKLFEYDLRPRNRIENNRSFFSSIMMGIFFSAGWSPCVGPVLGSILTLAMQPGLSNTALLMLTAYSFGMAFPFLLSTVAIGWFTKAIQKYGSILKYTEKIMGGFLVIIGFLLFWGILDKLSGLGSLINFGL